MADIDYYSLFRKQIEHEDTLISHRFSWLMMAQSFLFTAYAIAITNLYQLRAGGRDAADLASLQRLLCGIGIVSTVLIEVTILAGIMAMRELHRRYHAVQPTEPREPAPLQGRASTILLGFAAPVILPIFLCSVWILLLFRS